MLSELRPLSPSDLFDRAFDLYRENFALFAGVFAVFFIPLQVAISALAISLHFEKFRVERSIEDLGPFFGALSVLLAGYCVFFLVYSTLSGALVIAVTERTLDRPATIGSAFRLLRPNLFSMLFTWLLLLFLIGVASVVVMFILIFVLGLLVGLSQAAQGSGADPGGVLSLVLGFTVIILPIVIAAALFVAFALFATPIVAIERNGFVSVLPRNWSLLRRRFWPALWVFLGSILFVFALKYALFYTFELILQIVLYSWLPVSDMVRAIVMAVWDTALSLFLQPLLIVTITLLYLDQRMRLEGFDLAVRAQQRESQASLTTEPLKEAAA